MKADESENGSKMIELKQCPFCGNEATIIRHPGMNWDGSQDGLNIGALHGTWYVGCPYAFDDMYCCEVSPSASWYAKLEDAVYNWNKRK